MAQNEGRILLSSSPHYASPVSSRRLMSNVLTALAPVSIFGIVMYGVPALLTILVSVASALAAEALFRLVTKQDIRIKDLSAAVTGLLLALTLPPSTPLWMTALGAVFAVVVAKEFFGGLGANVFNPALIGRAFLVMSFPAAITTWHQPVGFGYALTDAVTTATPLGITKWGGTIADVGANFAAAGLSSGSDYWSVMKTLFIGNRAGCIGESSILLILAGAIYLLVTKTIDWRAPLTMIATTIVASLILGMDPLFGILSGGVLFGAVFMATDYVSAPITAKGKIIFGFGAGLIIVLIRKWGGYPEGVTYGILIMNAVSPFLNKLIQKKYGFVPKKKEAAK
ncbi:RnfABCDGE type electron transport complex subunit D [Breznakiella homolactica]|uniref:Ion-translocating oxidoreductase complex subunit D n=1 Tax=Breznakiella homolactica TaxID=2798577 RepID=A0A7T7XP08_9SPIR|nr:RnfABCDGE type electron transport complex subunit D [Breznakiella homolactica]QQO09851.1 RnfABCDGE type electron transport complex subunit D [Breznakiella homolactica]